MRQTVVLVFLAACSRGSSGAPADAAAVGDPAPAVDAVAPASSTAAEDAEAPSRVLHYRASLATFSDDLLDECADIYVDVTPPADAGVDWKPTIDPAEEMAKRSPNATRLTQKCREQFADRTMLAFCKATLPVQVTPGGAAIEATFLSSYFSYATVGATDRYMNDCLKMRGVWKAESRDSAAWRAAKLDDSRRKLDKLTK